MKFSMEKMVRRIISEGRDNLLTVDVLNIMKNLDGQEVTTASWARQVYGEPVMSCIGKDGKAYEVNEADCI